MNIIVTGHLPTSSEHAWREAGKWKYQAKTWEVTDSGNLEIFAANGRLVATHAAGAWAHVHSYAEE